MAETGSDAFPVRRREARERVEMLAHLRHGVTRATVMLKDLTRNGARIEGVRGLAEDEAVALALPGRQPSLAWVAWANDHSAGLEFAEPLPGAIFTALVRDFAMRAGSAALAA